MPLELVGMKNMGELWISSYYARSRASWDIPEELCKIRMLRETWVVKDWLIRPQRESRNSLKAVLAKFWQKNLTALPMAWEFSWGWTKNNGLISLMCEILRRHSIRSMVWLLLNALIHIYNDKEKVIKNVKFREKRCESKFKTVYRRVQITKHL